MRRSAPAYFCCAQEMLYTMYPAAAAREDSDGAARFEEDAEALLSQNGAAPSGLLPLR
jgi:hypothetical protein